MSPKRTSLILKYTLTSPYLHKDWNYNEERDNIQPIIAGKQSHSNILLFRNFSQSFLYTFLEKDFVLVMFESFT